MGRDVNGDNVRQTVNKCLLKLSDRDTETMAANELSALARSLPSAALLPFIAAISASAPSDKPPLRRHSLRLLSLLSAHHPHQTLIPLLPRMLSSALKKLRDNDSSVRLACVDAVRSISSVSAPASFGSTVLGPLFDALLHEQDGAAQLTAALCLASAIDVKSPHCEELGAGLQKMVPKLVKLLKSNAFKAKHALIAVLGSVVAAGGADTSALTGIVLPVLVEALAWEDWAARKAASEALAVLAVAERDRLVGFKTSCVATFESRRFDKVKIVRESMNRMLDLWREIPDVIDNDSKSDVNTAKSQSKSSVRESKSDAKYPLSSSNSAKSISPFAPRKDRLPSSRSPPEASPLKSRNHRLSPSKTEQNVEVSVPKTPLKAVTEERLKSSARVVPFEEEEMEGESKGGNGEQKDLGDLSLIRMQLAQIENQQTSLLDLLQKFMGTSQNGIHSLESRVHGLEMVLDEISRDLRVSDPNPNENEANTCCSFPGSEFLSPKYWRRNEGRYSSARYSVSDTQNLSEGRVSSYRHRFSQTGRGFMVNPLAEINPQIMRENISSEVKEQGRRA